MLEIEISKKINNFSRCVCTLRQERTVLVNILKSSPVTKILSVLRLSWDPKRKLEGKGAPPASFFQRCTLSVSRPLVSLGYTLPCSSASFHWSGGGNVSSRGLGSSHLHLKLDCVSIKETTTCRPVMSWCWRNLDQTLQCPVSMQRNMEELWNSWKSYESEMC